MTIYQVTLHHLNQLWAKIIIKFVSGVTVMTSVIIISL
jgi:hypothetical protein